MPTPIIKNDSSDSNLHNSSSLDPTAPEFVPSWSSFPVGQMIPDGVGLHKGSHQHLISHHGLPEYVDYGAGMLGAASCGDEYDWFIRHQMQGRNNWPAFHPYYPSLDYSQPAPVWPNCNISYASQRFPQLEHYSSWGMPDQLINTCPIPTHSEQWPQTIWHQRTDSVQQRQQEPQHT